MVHASDGSKVLVSLTLVQCGNCSGAGVSESTEAVGYVRFSAAAGGANLIALRELMLQATKWMLPSDILQLPKCTSQLA